MGRMSRPLSRILCFPRVREVANIHLGHPSLGASSSYLRTGRAASSHPTTPAAGAGALALLPVGFTWPHVSPRTPVRSYRTLSPLPRWREAVCSLLHFPADRSGLLLATTVPMWSPDFPRPRASPHEVAVRTGRVRPAGSFAGSQSTRFDPAKGNAQRWWATSLTQRTTPRSP